MKISVLSGKGGTGKTFVSVNLAAVIEDSVYVDCDVEAPNGELFFRPTELTESKVTVKIPVFDADLCNGCRKCVEFCNFNALAYVKGKPMLFPEVCHACGGCSLLCKQNAISEEEREVGSVFRGKIQNSSFLSGELNIGESSGMPVIHNLLKHIQKLEQPVIIDSPPGSGCMVMETIKDAEYCILVAEPTIYGCHNLKMVVELVKYFKKPFGVILNKSNQEENPTSTFLEKEGIPVLLHIPFDLKIANENAKGTIASLYFSEIRDKFEQLWKEIQTVMSLN